ncbi:unnamed protein product [Ectocarpus sp. 12 AP-2014]
MERDQQQRQVPGRGLETGRLPATPCSSNPATNTLPWRERRRARQSQPLRRPSAATTGLASATAIRTAVTTIACVVAAGVFLAVRSPHGIRPLQRGEAAAPPARAGSARPPPPPPPPPPLLLPRRAAGDRHFRGGEAVAASGGSGSRIGGETRRGSALAEELGGGGGVGDTTNTAVVVIAADTTAHAGGHGGSDGVSRVSGVARRAESQGDGCGRRSGGAGDWGDGDFRGGAARAGKGGKREAVNGGGRVMASTPNFHMLRVRNRNGEGERQGSDPPRLEFLGGEGEGGGESATSAPGPFSLRRYESFEAYATEQSASGNAILPVPIVRPPGKGPEASRSIPLAIIIGTQKGGTQNLRSHLLTHPSLSGLSKKEAHFFDWFWFPSDPKKKGHEWPGDGRGGAGLNASAAGEVLSAYADRTMKAVDPSKRDTMATVESTPLYFFFPLAPYRMKMVIPAARLVLILRDPTERYFSHLRMMMCWTRDGETFDHLEKRQETYFHIPGRVKEYLEQGEASYEPYTPLCRGEGARAKDLLRCWKAMATHDPLHRGLYADQLERWFRVYPRSQQILVVESSEMFRDFTGTLDKVARHIGLPPHRFSYDSRHQHASAPCERHHPELFAEGGRYQKMLEDQRVLQEWYRPHNERLYRLLGREMPWE